MPRAEAPLTEAAPSKIGGPVGFGGLTKPVEATGTDGTPVPTGTCGTTDGTTAGAVGSHS